jgi:uncharacterized membrane protein
MEKMEKMKSEHTHRMRARAHTHTHTHGKITFFFDKNVDNYFAYSSSTKKRESIVGNTV